MLELGNSRINVVWIEGVILAGEEESTLGGSHDVVGYHGRVSEWNVSNEVEDWVAALFVANVENMWLEGSVVFSGLIGIEGSLLRSGLGVLLLIGRKLSDFLFCEMRRIFDGGECL